MSPATKAIAADATWTKRLPTSVALHDGQAIHTGSTARARSQSPIGSAQSGHLLTGGFFSSQMREVVSFV